MASFTVKVRILGEAATSKAVNRAIRDLDKLDRRAARTGARARRGTGGFGGRAPGVGPGFGGSGFPVRGDETAPRRRRRGRGTAGATPPPIPPEFGGAPRRGNKARRQLNLASSLGAVSGQSARIARQTKDLFASPIRSAIELESALTQVQIKSGATEAEMKRLTAQTRRLGADTTVLASSAQAAGAQVFLATAGFDPKQIEGATAATLRFAQANADVDVGFAADFLSDIVTPFDVLSKSSSIPEIEKQFTRFSDVLTLTSNAANTGQRLLARALFKVSPVAKAAGFDIEQTAAAVGTLAAAGIKGSEAGTGLRGVLLALQAPTKQASKLLKLIGLDSKSFVDVKGNLIGLPQIFQKLDAALDKTFGENNLKKKSAVLNKFFGRRGIAIAGVLGKAATKGTLGGLETELRASGGATKAGALKIAGTTAGQLQAAQAQFEELKIELGQAFIPALLDAVNAMTPLVSGLGAFAKNNPGVTAAVGSLLAMVIPVALLTSAVTGFLAVGTAAASGLSKLNEVATNSKGKFNKASTGAAKFTGAIVALSAGLAAGSFIDKVFGISDFLSGAEPENQGVRVSAASLARESTFLKPEERKRLGRLRGELGTAKEESGDFFGGADARIRFQELDKLVAALQAVAETREAEAQKVKLEIGVKADGSITAQATGATVVDTGRQTQGL